MRNLRRVPSPRVPLMVVALIGLILGAAVTPSTAESSSDQAASYEPAAAGSTAELSVIDESLRLRSAFGLPPLDRTDLEALVTKAGVSLFDQESQQKLVNEWGFIGTTADAEVIQGRETLMVALRDDAPELLAFPGYAGSYFEGSKLILQHAGDKAPDGLESRLRRAGDDWYSHQVDSEASSTPVLP